MRYYFTKRQAAALKDKRLTPSIHIPLRNAILRVLRDFSDYDGPPDCSDNWSFIKAEDKLKKYYGRDYLVAFDNKGLLVSSPIHDVILSGLPEHVFDFIEAWCDSVDEPRAASFEHELNSILDIHGSPWRLLNKTMILLDSQYVREEIIAKTHYLLKEASASGALEEFGEAISCLTGGQPKEAIINAHKSVESVMKKCLGIERAKFGTLLTHLIKSGIIPEYYQDFLIHFEKLALGAVKERNQPARAHGQGAEPTSVDRSLAEFAVHLAGVINLFIIKRWIESRPKQDEPPADNDIPF
ncbi:MAG: hypothetical protein ABFD52_09035 [Acidobacteriota bacterium]